MAESQNHRVDDLKQRGFRVQGTSESAVIHLRIFSNAARPAATTVPQGFQIWNSDDNAPNFSDGTNWRDAMGAIT